MNRGRTESRGMPDQFDFDVSYLQCRPVSRKDLVQWVAGTLGQARRQGDYVAAIAVNISSVACYRAMHGESDAESMIDFAGSILVGLVGGIGRVFRTSDDSFLVLMTPIKDILHLNEIGKQLRDDLLSSLQGSGKMAGMDAAFGLAVAPVHTSDARQLVICAETALHYALMYRSDRFCIFQEQLDAEIRHENKILKALREICGSSGAALVYQPQIRCRDHSVVGAEALFRLDRSANGDCGVQGILEIAERAGMMADIDFAVARSVVEDMNGWARMGLEVPRIAVNVNGGLFDDWRGLNSYMNVFSGVSEDRVEFEVLETSFLDKSRRVNLMTYYANHAIRLSLDDFGVGYSSFDRLSMVPLNKLKVDRSLVNKGLSGALDSLDTMILVTARRLARSMNACSVAEGIESSGELKRAAGLGFDVAQGYFISKPMPAEQFVEWLGARRVIDPSVAA